MHSDPSSIRPKAGMRFVHRDGSVRVISSVRNGRVHHRDADGFGKVLTVLDAAQDPKKPMSFFGSHFGSWV